MLLGHFAILRMDPSIIFQHITMHYTVYERTLLGHIGKKVSGRDVGVLLTSFFTFSKGCCWVKERMPSQNALQKIVIKGHFPKIHNHVL